MSLLLHEYSRDHILMFSAVGEKDGCTCKMILLLALLLALTDAGITSIIPNYKVQWFTQEVDHFNFLSTDTFKQRYLITGTYLSKH